MNIFNFQGGTSDTGNNARKWLSPEKRDAIVALALPRDEGEEENWARLLQFDNVVFRIASSTRFIHTPKFKKFLQEGIIFQMLAFHYAPLTKTALKMYFHIVESIEKNNFRGTGQKSEGPMETSQKEIRRIIKENTRRDTLEHCLQDTLKFRMRWTNYLQRKLRAKRQKIIPDPMASEDDLLVASFFVDDPDEITEPPKTFEQYSYS